MTDEVLYAPSPWGEVFHNLPHNEALGAGAAGPGKSMILLMDPFQQINVEHERCLDRRHPHYHPWGQSKGWALHLRRTRPMLEQTIARSQRIFPTIDPDAKYHSQTTTWTFRSGYKYQFGHCMNPGDWEIYQSSEFSWIGFDELVQFEKDQYDNICTRLRSTDPLLKDMLRVRSMSNPVLKREAGFNQTVKDPQWVRKHFVEPHPEGKKTLKKKITRSDGRVSYRTRIYLPATLFDNPDPVFVEQYEEQLLDAPEHIRQALLYGNWWVTAGSFYADAWNNQLHVCQPFKIPSNWLRFRSMDWGFKNPGTILWWAMDEDDNIFCEREYSFTGKFDNEVAARCKEIEQDLGLWGRGQSLITGPADTQLWEERGDNAKRKVDVFKECGVPWRQADKRSRQANAEKLHKRMKDHQNGMTTPGIVFFNTCKMCVTTIPGIQTDPDDPECPADGGEDHWHDAVLYAVAFASHGRKGIPTIKDDDWDERPQRKRKRGRHGYG